MKRSNLVYFISIAMTFGGCASTSLSNSNQSPGATERSLENRSRTGQLECVRGARSGYIVYVLLRQPTTKESVELVGYDEGLLKLCEQRGHAVSVEVKGEPTSKFLFWGGNYQVSSYRVI